MTRVSTDRRRRGGWYRTMIQWHWVSSGVCLVGMILFSVTGITLNHAAEIEAKAAVETRKARLPEGVLKAVNEASLGESAPLPAVVARSLRSLLGAPIGAGPAEWKDGEVYLSMQGPGGDAWLTIDRATGEVEYERTSRGWIAYLNDLHKGRHTGVVWKWFLDIFAVAALVFCFTGLYLLYFHARHRGMTWPVVALGLIIPVVLALLMALHP